MDVGAWLRELGLEQYEAAFRENGVTADVLRHLTADDLKELGVTAVGHRRQLLVAIAALRPGEPPPEPLTQVSPSPPIPPTDSLTASDTTACAAERNRKPA
jgi:hypothetical protein